MSHKAAGVIQRRQRQKAAALEVDRKKRLLEQKKRVLEEFPDVPHDLVVYIQGCTELWDRDGGMSGKSDPYIKVYKRKDASSADVNDSEEEELVFESARADNTLKPTWQRSETTFCTTLIPSRVHRDLRFEVWNWNSFSDNILGSFNYAVGDIFESGSGTFTFPLQLHRTDDVEAFAYSAGGGKFGFLTMNVDIRAPADGYPTTANGGLAEKEHNEPQGNPENSSPPQPTSSGSDDERESKGGKTPEVEFYIANCRNLVQADGTFSGVTDAFVVIKDLDGERRLRTPTVDNNLNPSWEPSESSVSIALLDPSSSPSSVLDQQKILIEVWNWNATKDDFLGQAQLSVRQIYTRGSGPQELELLPKEGEPSSEIISKRFQQKGNLGTVKVFFTVPEYIEVEGEESRSLSQAPLARENSVCVIQHAARRKRACDRVSERKRSREVNQNQHQNSEEEGNLGPNSNESSKDQPEEKHASESAQEKKETTTTSRPTSGKAKGGDGGVIYYNTDEDDMVTIRIPKKDTSKVEVYQSGVKVKQFALRVKKSGINSKQQSEEEEPAEESDTTSSSFLPPVPTLLKAALYEIEAFGPEEDDETPEQEKGDQDGEEVKKKRKEPHHGSSAFALSQSASDGGINYYANAMLMLSALHKRTVELGEELVSGASPSASVLKEKLSIIESGCFQQIRETRPTGPAFGTKPSLLQMVYNSQNVELDVVRKANDGTTKTTIERLPFSLADIVQRCESTEKDVRAAETKYQEAVEAYEDAVMGTTQSEKERKKGTSSQQEGDSETKRNNDKTAKLDLKSLRVEIRDSLSDLHDKRLQAGQHRENKALIQFALEVMHSAEAKELPIASDKDRLQPLAMLRMIRSNITVLEEKIREHQRAPTNGAKKQGINNKSGASSPARSQSRQRGVDGAESQASSTTAAISDRPHNQTQQDQQSTRPSSANTNATTTGGGELSSIHPESEASGVSRTPTSRPPPTPTKRPSSKNGKGEPSSRLAQHTHQAGAVKPSALSTTIYMQQLQQQAQAEKQQFDRVGAYRDLEALRNKEQVLEACLAEKKHILNLVHRDRLQFVEQVSDQKALLKEKDGEVMRATGHSTHLQHRVYQLEDDKRSLLKALETEKARVVSLHANIAAVREKRRTGDGRTVTPYDIMADTEATQPINDEKTEALLKRLYDRELHKIQNPKPLPNTLVTPVEPIELEDFTKRMYYERKDRSQKQRKVLEKKFLSKDEKDKVPKEKVEGTVERLAVTQIVNKKQKLEDIYKREVLSKDPVMAKRSQSELDEIVQRFYVKK